MDEIVKHLREPCQYENCILCQQAANTIEQLSELALNEHNRAAIATWKNHWISVTERLPNEKEKVLAVCKNGKMFVAEHLSNTYCNDGWNVIGPLGGKRRIGNNRVTHWMPLPQKPISE